MNLARFRSVFNKMNSGLINYHGYIQSIDEEVEDEWRWKTISLVFSSRKMKSKISMEFQRFQRKMFNFASICFEFVEHTEQNSEANRCETTSTGKSHRPFVGCSIKEAKRSLVNRLHVSRISQRWQEQKWACWASACMSGICVSLMNRWAETRQTTPGISTLLKAFCYFVVLSMRFNVIDVRPTILFSGRFFFIFVIRSECFCSRLSCISVCRVAANSLVIYFDRYDSVRLLWPRRSIVFSIL